MFEFHRTDETTMTTIPKLITVALAFAKAAPEHLLSQGYAVLKGLTANLNFTNLPINLDVLKAALDAYAAALIDAQDGSKKAIALRNRLGEDLIRILRTLTTFVQLNCKDDMNIFLTSGFQARSG